jgi:1,4-dihydroxy-6-naphthoate synthase
MNISLGFSPCPNDTFIFDALVNHKINTAGLEFDVHLEDVQTLNRRAMEQDFDVSKISYGVLPFVHRDYVVLESGGALGKGVGPLLIAKTPLPDGAGLAEKTIAIPGENTTAHLLFSLAYPHATHKKFLVFSGIEEAVLNGEADLGVIIHENRFTYQQRGLVKITDLGEFWEKETGNPIPLGGIIAKRSMPRDVLQLLDNLIRESVDYAFANYPHLSAYVKEHAQEMEEQVMKQHVDLYVNDYSRALGHNGRAAVKKLLSVYDKLHSGRATHSPVLFLGEEAGTIIS